MPTSVQSPADALHELLVPSTREGQDALQNNPTLKRASEAYKHSLANDNVDKMRSELHRIAEQLHSDHLFDAPGERVVSTFNFEPYEMRVETPAEAQEAPSSLESPQKKGSEEKSHGGGGTTTYDRTNDAIKEKVQGSVRKEFEQLLATTKPDDLPQALEQFYHTHLSASGVLGSQYEVLLEQSKRLYGGKEEFEEHNLALKKATDSRLGQLEDVHTFGPIRPGETEGKKEEEIKERMAALDRQRQIEQANLKNLQMIAHSSSEKDRARNLKMAMDTLFNREWERREQQDALLDQFAEEFKVYAKNIYQPRESIIEEFGTGVAAVTLTEQAYMQERGTTQVTQGPTFAQQQSGGSNVASNVTQKAKDIGNKIRKKLARKTEEELAEKALEKGAEQAAATGVRAFLAANPEILLIILLVIAAFLLIFIVIMIIVSVIGGNNQQQQQQQYTPIPGLTLNVAYPQAVQNGQNVPYTIDVTYTGTDSITITDTIPANTNDIQQTGTFNSNGGLITWLLDSNKPLPDSTSTSKHYQFKITLQPTQKDIQITNMVTATYTNGGPSQSGSGGGGPTAGGYCSPSNLAKYFGSAQNGRIASCICKYESGGDPGAENKACLRGGTADYSIGLFQINLIAHCSGALVMHGAYCSVADARTLSRCTLSMMDPVNNINEAVALYRGTNGFSGPWAAEKGKCF